MTPAIYEYWNIWIVIANIFNVSKTYMAFVGVNVHAHVHI